MRFWREVIADRYSGGLLGLLLALSFALQTLATGWAAAAMIAPDPLHILCTSAPEGERSSPEPTHQHECPCSELCGAGIHPSDAFVPSDAVGVPIRFADRIEVTVDHNEAMCAGRVVRPYHATGPPALDPD